MNATSSFGKVWLVGAGPGDPDLLTLRAARLIMGARIIVHDGLVDPRILAMASPSAQMISVAKRRSRHSMPQDEINALLVREALAGREVLRLKGGDPFIFGRGGEEIAALRAAGVAYAVIPGITAGLGAAAESEVPLTYRQEALRITFLTAHKAEDAGNVDWSALTDTKMTVVVYMGMTAAPTIREGLLAAGRSPDTPVGVFARVTRPDSQAVVGTLRDLPSLADQVKAGPAILIIGDVVSRSAPWRNGQLQANPDDLISDLLMAAE